MFSDLLNKNGQNFAASMYIMQRCLLENYAELINVWYVIGNSLLHVK